MQTIDCCKYFMRKDKEGGEGEAGGGGGGKDEAEREALKEGGKVCLLSPWTLESNELNEGMRKVLKEALAEGDPSKPFSQCSSLSASLSAF